VKELPVDTDAPVAPDVAQARLAAIIESSDDAIVAKTLDGIITSWNPAAERIFGYPAGEVLGRSIMIVIPEDRRGEEEDVLARLRRGEKIDHFETVRRAKDGRLIDVSLTVSPIKDSTGRIVGASKVARDVTERKRADAERQGWLEREQKARREAERAVQAKDEFLAIVSHELRSPLNAIVGWAHLLGTGQLDAERTTRAVETILRNAHLQSQLISDILDVQRLASGKVRLEIQSIDLALVLEAALDAVRPSADARRIGLTRVLEASSSELPGDPDRIQQVIFNLLSNAVKFTPEGGAIRVSLRRDGNALELVVEDSGPGIKPEFLPHVFERFRQDVSSLPRSGGLGLGLAIVRSLVELHSGTVTAANRPEGGARFTVRLPRTGSGGVAAMTASAGAGLGSTAGSQAPTLHALRVLVVDDEPDAREVVAAVLGQYGADVVVARSTEEGLALLSRVRPHVLVSDISMPGEDGYSLLRTVRGLPESEGGRTPAIALTAATSTDDRLRALRAGFQFHIPKPVQPVDLVEAIATLALLKDPPKG
jgi:PAS domain S-box-containing protein